MYYSRIQATDTATHHFFTVNARTFRPNVRDPDGRILVFTDRVLADAEARRRWGATVVMCVVGMGGEKWERFQREEKFRII